MAQPLVILGASARAAAACALRAGYAPWCIDLRGDRDLREMPGVSVRTCPASRFPTAMLAMLDQAPAGAPVLLTRPLDNEVDFVRAVAFERTILGSGVEAIEQTRDPLILSSLRPIKDVRACTTLTHVSWGRRLRGLLLGGLGRSKYLLKPENTSEGRGIEWWSPTAHIPSGYFLQEYVRGQAYAAVFNADGWSCSLLGILERLTGESAFGAMGFRTCGFLGPVGFSEKSRLALSHLGVQLTQRQDMRGLFSVDFIMDFKGRLGPIGVHPCYPDAAELIERAAGASLLAGRPGAASVSVATHGQAASVIWGKAAVIARDDVVTPDLYRWFAKDEIADVPAPGTAIARDEVICTVFASSRKQDECLQRLKDMAGKVYQCLEGPESRVQSPESRVQSPESRVQSP